METTRQTVEVDSTLQAVVLTKRGLNRALARMIAESVEAETEALLRLDLLCNVGRADGRTDTIQ